MIGIKPIIFIFICIFAWHFASESEVVSSVLFPGPFKTMIALNEWFLSGHLASDVFSSTWRIVFGLVFGVFFGIVFGLAMGRIIFLEETFSLVLNVLRAMPPVALIPLVIIWLGIGDFAKIFSISFAVFFPVWISALIGAKSIHLDYIKTAQIFSKSRLETITKVLIPATVPFLVNGIRIGIGIAFIMAFVSELAGSSSGLGYFIATAQTTYRSDQLIAGLIVLGALAAITDYLFVKTIKLTFKWVDVQ